MPSHNDANTHSEGSLIRRLLPHALWDFIKTIAEFLWAFAGAALLTGVGWLIAKVRNEVDYTGIVVTFITGFMIIFLLRLNRNSSPSNREIQVTNEEQKSLQKEVVVPQPSRLIDGLDDVPMVDIYSLKYITSKSDAVRKTELVGYLKERGIDADEDYPTLFLRRMAHFVVRTHDDRLEVPAELRNALIEKLPKFRLGKLPEHRLPDSLAILQSQLEEERKKTNNKDQLLREAKDAHRTTRQELERSLEGNKQQKAQLDAYGDELQRRQSAGRQDAAEIERLKSESAGYKKERNHYEGLWKVEHDKIEGIKWPHLACGQLTGLGYVIPNILGAGLTIVNNETRYASIAHNVRAYLRFQHRAHGDVIKAPGVWQQSIDADGQRRFSESVSLGMGEHKELLLFLWDSNVVPRDFRAVNQESPVFAGTERLQYGEWDIEIVLTGDNLIRQTHTAPFTLTPKGGIPGLL